MQPDFFLLALFGVIVLDVEQKAAPRRINFYYLRGMPLAARRRISKFRSNQDELDRGPEELDFVAHLERRHVLIQVVPPALLHSIHCCSRAAAVAAVEGRDERPESRRFLLVSLILLHDNRALGLERLRLTEGSIRERLVGSVGPKGPATSAGYLQGCM